MSKSTENWFEQTNKYKYLELMCIMTRKDVTTLKEIHGVLKGTGLWVDVKRFIKSNKQFNPAGLFELFGSFSNQTAEDVHDCLMGWIYDNYNNVKNWLKMAVLHKKIDLNDWIEQMRLNTTHGDDIALYLLCHMYNKHAYVHEIWMEYLTIQDRHTIHRNNEKVWHWISTAPLLVLWGGIENTTSPTAQQTKEPAVHGCY